MGWVQCLCGTGRGGGNSWRHGGAGSVDASRETCCRSGRACKSRPNCPDKMSSGVMIGLFANRYGESQDFVVPAFLAMGSNCSLDETRHGSVTIHGGQPIASPCLARLGLQARGASRRVRCPCQGRGGGAGRAGKSSIRWRQHAQALPRSWIGRGKMHARVCRATKHKQSVSRVVHVDCKEGRRRQLRDCVCRMACLMVIFVVQCRHERPTMLHRQVSPAIIPRLSPGGCSSALTL